MLMTQKVLFWTVFFGLVMVQASQSDCDSIITHLKQMKKAQTAVQSSLINNHEMLAESLESYSDALSSSGGRAYKTISASMIKASTSLKERGNKGAQLSQKLSDQTDELIKIIEKCIKQ